MSHIFKKFYPFFLFFLLILTTKAQFKGISCTDFNTFMKEQANFLEEIQPSKKYEKDVKSVYPGPPSR
jgi:hypothetical protein